MPLTIDCTGLTTRQINERLKAAASEAEVVVRNPDARHNLAVALLRPIRVVFEGSVGYYCAGLGDGATVEVRGSAGWGLAESMLSGTVVVDGHAGSAAAASIRGGTVVIRGDAGARAGVAMKGGTLLVGGSCGPMAAFMMQKGRLIVCGDAGDGLADSMYEGIVFVGGKVASPGNDTVEDDPTPTEAEEIAALLDAHGVRAPARFRKLVSGRKLWNFDRKELAVWRAAL